MPRVKRNTPTQKKIVHDQFKKGWKGSAIGFFNEFHVSPSSFKRIVHELRQDKGSVYILDERIPTTSPHGTPYCTYYMNPEIRRQLATEGPIVQQDMFDC